MQNHCKWVLPKVEKVSTFAVHSDRRDRCLGNGCRQSKNLNCYVYVRKMAVLSGGWPLLFLRAALARCEQAGRDSFVGQESGAASGLAKRQSATLPKSGRQGEKSRQVFGKRSALFIDRRPFFHRTTARVKTKWLHLPKRAPTYAGRLHFAADGAHRHRTAGRQAAEVRHICAGSPLNPLQI